MTASPSQLTSTRPLIEVQGLRKLYPVSKGIFRKPTDFIHAVDGIDFAIGQARRPGTWLGRRDLAAKGGANEIDDLGIEVHRGEFPQVLRTGFDAPLRHRFDA